MSNPFDHFLPQLPRELADALDSQTDGGSSSPGSLTLAAGTGATGPSVFGDWGSLYTALSEARELAGGKPQFTLYFDDTVATCSIPAGSYDMKNVTWCGIRRTGLNTGRSIVEIEEGATFTDLFHFVNLEVSNKATATSPLTTVNFDHFSFEKCSVLSGTGNSVSFIDGSAVGSGEIFIIELHDTAFGSPTGPNAVLEMGESGSFANLDLYGKAFVGADSVEGVAGSLVNLNRLSQEAKFSGDQTPYSGTLDVPGAGTQPAPLFGFVPAASAAALTSATTSVGANWAQFVRADVSGGAFQLTLIDVGVSDAFSHNGRKLIIKEVSNTAGLTVKAGGTDTIDGSTGAVTVAANGCLELMCDGISGWYIISNYDPLA